MFTICGRKVKLATGTCTQTVNICTAAGTHGEYEYVIRFHSPNAVTARGLEKARVRSIEEFVALLQEQGGDLESSSQRPIKSRVPRVQTDAAPPTHWEIAAREATESAINQLAQEFIENPYLHRVEHSIHCRLYQLMSTIPPLDQRLTFGSWLTQPIHKEWPEYLSRPERGNRRGNFDLVVLSPQAVAAASLNDFRSGEIRPCIAIEMGLDYGQSHLAGDIHKFRNSRIRDSYLVHLSRPDAPDSDGSAESLLLGCEFKSVYVKHLGDRVRFKLLGDSAIQERVCSRCGHPTSASSGKPRGRLRK